MTELHEASTNPPATVLDVADAPAFLAWVAALDTEDDLIDAYGPGDTALDEARSTAMSDLDDLIATARRILTATTAPDPGQGWAPYTYIPPADRADGTAAVATYGDTIVHVGTPTTCRAYITRHTITRVRCLAPGCGHTTRDPHDIEAWNDYGDHPDQTHDTTTTAWHKADGTTYLCGPTDTPPFWWERDVPADPATL